MKIAVVDYGMGNLHSVIGALDAASLPCFVAKQPDAVRQASHVVLPGVGGFSEGMANLQKGGWIESLSAAAIEHQKPFLGICLGMQMLADFGQEGGRSAGLGLVPGKVVRLDKLGCTKRIPHVGWNSVHLADDKCELMKGVPTGTDFYFVHSFAFQVSEPQEEIGYADYGIAVPAIVARANVLGTQFHPEKSSRAGSQILRNFAEIS